MKQRVALIATCACLILCIAYLTVCSNATQKAMTASVADGLLKMCRMSEDTVDTAAFLESPASELRTLASRAGAGASLLDANGYVLLDTRTSSLAGSDASRDAEIAETLLNGQGTSVRPHNKTTYVFAAHRFDDGRILRLYQVAPTAQRALSGNLGRLILLTLLAAAICYTVNRIALRGVFAFAEHTSKLLEAFSEGQFDRRIARSSGEPRDYAARINAVAGRIEDQLLKSRQRNHALSLVMNQMQNGILAVDSELNVIFVTASAKQMLGFTGSPEGMPISQASKDVKLDTLLTAAMGQDNVYQSEVAARTGVGRSHRPLRLYVSAMRQDGESIGAVALVEDITELRRLEQIRTDFAANVSHELKTPLTSIKGFVETLQEGAINNPEMAQKFLRIIMLEADRLTRLINDILTISKFESGKDEVSCAKIRIDQKALDVCEMLSIHAAEKQVSIHEPNLSQTPLFIWGNPDRVEQMLINLIENAIKYNRQGGSVTVSVYASEAGVQLLVSDTGIGIAEEHVPRLFERFYRVDKGRSRSMGGTGLGLAIVKHIVRSMDGMIEVHSKLGEGTEFLVTLPLYDKPDEEMPENAEDTP